MIMGAIKKRLLSSESQLPLTLTARQRHIAELVLAGDSNKQIAAELGISEQTVKNTVGTIYDKAGVSHSRHGVPTSLVAGVLMDLESRIRALEDKSLEMGVYRPEERRGA